MALLAPARSEEPEWLDRSGHDPVVLAENFRDLRRVNRWLGGTYLTLQALAGLTAQWPSGSRLAVVDVGAGDGEMSRAIAAWAARQGLEPRVIALDVNREFLTLSGPDGPDSVVADGRRLPLADGSFDIALSSLTLHHLSPSAAGIMLQEMGRVARRSLIVNDLVRAWPGYLGAWLVSRLFTQNPLSRHDAALSVRRAYTRDEMRSLAVEAGLRDIRFIGFPGYRVAMTASAGGR